MIEAGEKQWKREDFSSGTTRHINWEGSQSELGKHGAHGTEGRVDRQDFDGGFQALDSLSLFVCFWSLWRFRSRSFFLRLPFFPLQEGAESAGPDPAWKRGDGL